MWEFNTDEANEEVLVSELLDHYAPVIREFFVSSKVNRFFNSTCVSLLMAFGTAFIFVKLCQPWADVFLSSTEGAIIGISLKSYFILFVNIATSMIFTLAVVGIFRLLIKCNLRLYYGIKIDILLKQIIQIALDAEKKNDEEETVTVYYHDENGNLHSIDGSVTYVNLDNEFEVLEDDDLDGLF